MLMRIFLDGNIRIFFIICKKNFVFYVKING